MGGPVVHRAHEAADHDYGAGVEEFGQAYIPTREPERGASGPDLGGKTWSRRRS